jgi:hypothetical protein
MQIQNPLNPLSEMLTKGLNVFKSHPSKYDVKTGKTITEKSPYEKFMPNEGDAIITALKTPNPEATNATYTSAITTIKEVHNQLLKEIEKDKFNFVAQAALFWTILALSADQLTQAQAMANAFPNPEKETANAIIAQHINAFSETLDTKVPNKLIPLVVNIKETQKSQPYQDKVKILQTSRVTKVKDFVSLFTRLGELMTFAAKYIFDASFRKKFNTTTMAHKDLFGNTVEKAVNPHSHQLTK